MDLYLKSRRIKQITEKQVIIWTKDVWNRQKGIYLSGYMAYFYPLHGFTGVTNSH